MVEKKKDNTNRNLVLIGIISIIVIIYITTMISSMIGDGLRGSEVAVIPITGEITSRSVSQGLFQFTTGSQTIVNQIQRANENPGVAAIYLEIDSPGGTPVASHEIVKAIKNVDKPTIAVIRELGASGAYWIASAADYVIADELSLTGSIGVQGSYIGIYGLMDMYNVTYERLAGGEYKDIATPLRPMSEEEKELMEVKINLMHEFFKEDVRQNRNLTQEEINDIGTGIFYIGIEAYENGLIDELGGKEEAVNYLEETLNKTVNLVRQERSRGLFDSLFGLASDEAIIKLK